MIMTRFPVSRAAGGKTVLNSVAHTHDHVRTGSRNALALALALTAAYTVAEVAGGLLTGSLALLADAVHMLSDNVALVLALFAVWLADRPSTPERTYGYKRAEVLAALANGVALVALSIWIFYEAFQRFRDPPEVLGGWMLVLGAAGIAVNVAAGIILSRSRRHSLNVEAAFRHVFADLLGSVGVVAAAAVILTTGWLEADPLVSVLIGVLVLVSSWSILRDSATILLEAAPSGLDTRAVGERLARAPGVAEVHDLHIWTITSGFPALSAHVLVGRGEDCHARRLELAELLEKEFGIEHTTLQVDHVGERGALVELERRF
jgi:cobalt-zinc-cadmium efflux system protein